MTNKQKSYKARLIKAVHISTKYKEYFASHDDDYRAKLREHFWVTSSKELNITQLKVLVKWLMYEIPDLPIIKDRSEEITEAQISLMLKLWDQYANDTSEQALRAFIYKVTKNRYLRVDKLSRGDATQCIVILKKTLKGKR